MAYTQDQYARLCESIALGAVTVQYSDRTVTYRSLTQMLQIKQLMEKELFPNSVNSAGTRVKMIFDKGL